MFYRLSIVRRKKCRYSTAQKVTTSCAEHRNAKQHRLLHRAGAVPFLSHTELPYRNVPFGSHLLVTTAQILCRRPCFFGSSRNSSSKSSANLTTLLQYFGQNKPGRLLAAARSSVIILNYIHPNSLYHTSQKKQY